MYPRNRKTRFIQGNRLHLPLPRGIQRIDNYIKINYLVRKTNSSGSTFPVALGSSDRCTFSAASWPGCRMVVSKDPKNLRQTEETGSNPHFGIPGEGPGTDA